MRNFQKNQPNSLVWPLPSANSGTLVKKQIDQFQKNTDSKWRFCLFRSLMTVKLVSVPILMIFALLGCQKDIDVIVFNPPQTLSEQLPGDWDLDAVGYVSNITIDLNGIPLPITSTDTDKNANGDMSVHGNNLNCSARFTLLLSTIPNIPSFPVPVNLQFTGSFSITSNGITVQTSDGPRTLDVVSHGPYHIAFQTSTTASIPLPIPGFNNIPVEMTLHFVK